MTANEILKMDSTIFIQVGASQLQKILLTLKAYRDNLEVAENTIREKNQELLELRRLADKQSAEIQRMLNTSITIRQVGDITGY